ncbi:DnaJ domain-containing protein [Mycena galopus ATCC 62051]|nr:DnaJ domain-containing protein [Mycena galopus ATCC 62051]
MHRRALSTTGCRRGTHYDTLGVRREASLDQIKTAFFAMSKEHHPDVPHHKVKPQFHEITEAYNVLRDPVSRRAYDNTLPAPQGPAASTLHARHLADTAARFRRASRPPQSSPSTSAFSPRTRHSSPMETPFPRRASADIPLAGANDRHHRHPGQRYRPPDPKVQAAAWAAQQALLRENKTRSQRFMASMMLALGMIVTGGWYLS